MTFDGRLEARMTVPAGVSVSATNAGGTATVVLPQGTHFLTDLLTTLASQLNSTSPLSATWSATLSTGTAGTGQVTLNGGGTWSLTWTTAGATLQSLLGFDVTGNVLNSAAAVTGSKQARGLWRPDCPLWMEGDPKRAPKVSDLRQTMSPTANVLGLVGNFFYRHMKVTWEMVPFAQAWEAVASVPNASWEFFFNETQLGQNSSWFTPSSPFQIYDHNGNKVGADANGGAGLTNGWFQLGTVSIEPARYDKGGAPILWTVELASIVSPG